MRKFYLIILMLVISGMLSLAFYNDIFLIDSSMSKHFIENETISIASISKEENVTNYNELQYKTIDYINQKNNMTKDRYVLKINFNETVNNKLLYTKHVYGKYYTVINENNNVVYESSKFFFENFSPEMNSSYIRFSGDELYFDIHTSNKILWSGLASDTYLVDSRVNEYKFRISIGLLLMFLGLIITIVNSFVEDFKKYPIVESLGIFLSFFGLWVFLDFSRHASFITTFFSQIPASILLIIFLISANLIVPYFIKTNYHMISSYRFKSYIKIFYFISWGLTIIRLLFHGVHIVYWSSEIYSLEQNFIYIYNLIISIGSLLLIPIAWLDSRFTHIKGRIYAIGLTGCLITFTVSQLTEYIISHIGVLWLLITVLWVVGKEFVELKKEKDNHMHLLKKSNIEIKHLNAELKFTQKELLMRLGSTVDLRSKETSQHVQRVSTITSFIAQHLNYSNERSELLTLASTLHDIGKVGIPDKILNNPGIYTDEEYQEMKNHAKFGYEILNGSLNPLLEIAAVVALTHHEKYDGSGYPNGISGNEIPMDGAIVAAADVFDALISKRVYKDAWTFQQVYNYFEEQNGKHFHPKVAKVVLNNFDELKEIILDIKD